MSEKKSKMVEITTEEDLWNKCYTAHSLVLIGSKEKNGEYNLAPKHMAMPLGFSNYFGFMGTPRKSTYRNIKREKEFTVSFPRPSQLVISSLTASRREKDQSKPIIEKVPTVPAKKIEGQFLQEAYIQLECKFSQMLGKFGEWEIITGEIVAAYIHEKAMRKRGENGDAAKHIYENPLLAYLHPDRFSIIKESYRFPYPKDFKR